jgi:hypothetical protein
VGHANANAGATTRNAKSRWLKLIEHDWSQSTRWQLASLISLSKLKSIQATSRTKKGDSRFDPVYRGSRATLGVCRNRRTRFAVNRTVFTDELSERNTEIILCKHIFYSSFLQALPARLQLAVEVGLPNRHILIPHIEIIPASFRPAPRRAKNGNSRRISHSP